jgi:hypothetical protein
MGRDTRDFGGKWGDSGLGRPSVDVSRDAGGERERRLAWSQLLARTGDPTKKAQAAGLSLVC